MGPVSRADRVIGPLFTYGRLTLMDRKRTDAVWMKYGRSLWKFAGSYGLGIALMLILLVLTFAGTSPK